MIRHALLLLMVVLPGGFAALRGEQVLVTGVAGQVLFAGGAGAVPWKVVKAGQHYGAGTFSAAGDAILYLSTFPGSELRLSEGGTIHFDGTDEVCRMEATNGARSTFRLLKGKVQVSIKFPSTPPHCYHIILAKAETSMSRGQCVMCMHGAGTFLFVSRGDMMVTTDYPEPVQPIKPLEQENTPVYGALPGTPVSPMPMVRGDRTQVLIGNGQVGVVGVDGDLSVQPLSAMAAGTQTCLLSGFNSEMAEGAGSKKKAAAISPDAATTPGLEMPTDTNRPPAFLRPQVRIVVSPTQ